MPPPDEPACAERRRRWSDTYKGVADSDEEEVNGRLNGSADPKLRREEQELAKIDSGIAQVFLKEVKEREKLQQWKRQNLDPRNASRCVPRPPRRAAPCRLTDRGLLQDAVGRARDGAPPALLVAPGRLAVAQLGPPARGLGRARARPRLALAHPQLQR